ncbi:hypothetical protein SACE_3975 [Saccharopolyspora erythraea NRRL 2338]|uniref:HTH cro/C1-type domain-containing protein n=2 Tax=Saccharopolyspora erythraea TaxID=1836 RepID=A4FGS1_SACEN|nr:hypothetical protein SACE_3975 [Saccharopolyspora erythraea NRRL 2338]
MSNLWSGTPSSLKLGDLDAMCAALDCEVGDLLVAERSRPPVAGGEAAAGQGGGR